MTMTMGKSRWKGASGADVLPLYRQPWEAGRLFIRASLLDGRKETWELSEKLYREVVRIAPGHVEAWNNLGVMAFKLGRSAGALEAWGQALLLDPGRAETHNNIGHLFQTEMKLELASVYLLRAVKADPDMEEARVNLALVLQGLGRFRVALRHWRQYLQRFPRGEFTSLARKHEGICAEAGRR